MKMKNPTGKEVECEGSGVDADMNVAEMRFKAHLDVPTAIDDLIKWIDCAIEHQSVKGEPMISMKLKRLKRTAISFKNDLQDQMKQIDGLFIEKQMNVFPSL